MKHLTDKEVILDLKDGESFEIEYSDGAGIEVWKKGGVWILFEIPLHGGTPRFVDGYPINRIDEMIDTYQNWT